MAPRFEDDEVLAALDDFRGDLSRAVEGEERDRYVLGQTLQRRPIGDHRASVAHDRVPGRHALGDVQQLHRDRLCEGGQASIAVMVAGMSERPAVGVRSAMLVAGRRPARTAASMSCLVTCRVAD